MSDYILPSLPELLPVSPGITSSCFHHVTVEEHISLLPCYVGQLSRGIIEHLNSKVLRYSDDYRGVLLSYSRPSVLQPCGRLLDEQPHIHFTVNYQAYVFKPVIGQVMCGIVNKIGREHIGCLVHQCFNASVVGRNVEHKGLYNTLFDTGQFDLGCEIWFTVTQVEHSGGLLYIAGEHYDIGVSDGCHSNSRKRKKHHSSDRHHSKRKRMKKDIEVATPPPTDKGHSLDDRVATPPHSDEGHSLDDRVATPPHSDDDDGRKKRKKKRRTRDIDVVEEGVSREGCGSGRGLSESEGERKVKRRKSKHSSWTDCNSVKRKHKTVHV